MDTIWNCLGFSGKFAVSIALSIAWISPAVGHAEPGNIALVYKGSGSCSDQCSQNAAAVAKRAGFTVRYVDVARLNQKVFEGAVVWIQPGGNAIRATRALGAAKRKLIQDFVWRGGNYVGFCAGAFLADRTVDNAEKLAGLGIIPIGTADFAGDKGRSGTILEVSWGGQRRDVFFNEGGTFLLHPDHPVDVLAHYADGSPAAIQATYGAGRVVVSGFHPEATDDWKKDAIGVDADGPDFDLADEMLRRAVGR